jgi:hypothetical protein
MHEPSAKSLTLREVGPFGSRLATATPRATAASPYRRSPVSRYASVSDLKSVQTCYLAGEPVRNPKKVFLPESWLTDGRWCCTPSVNTVFTCN